jgi:hypothetical protein
MIRILRKLLFTVATVLCVGITAYNINNVPIETNGTVYLVDEYTDTYYEVLSDNVGLTTINGISNVYVNMKADGYSVYSEDITSSYIDVSFTKDNCPSYRYYFTYPECKITFFCSEYENSYTGLSYIIERRD